MTLDFSTNPDLYLYVAHIAYWSSFGVTRLVVRITQPDTLDAAGPAPAADNETKAPGMNALIVLHAFAFGMMYFGIGNAVIPNRVPEWLPGQRVLGAAVIALGAFMMGWSLTWFRSWRIRAKLEVGHRLATGGPFRLVRHPIYLGLNLLALGTVIWAPTPACFVALLLTVLGSDLRGRAEEKLLVAAFGQRYEEYCAHTRRFLPGIY